MKVYVVFHGTAYVEGCDVLVFAKREHAVAYCNAREGFKNDGYDPDVWADGEDRYMQIEEHEVQ